MGLHEIIPFGGKLWQCVGAISNTGESFFKVKSKWIMIKDGKEQELCEEFLLKTCSIAFYDQENIKQMSQNEKLSYIGKELTTIREKTQKRKKYQKDYRQENLDEYKDYQKGYQKEYREENPDYQKEYRLENPDYQKEYRQENLDEYKDYQKEYRQENLDEYTDVQKEYRQENLDEYKDYQKG